MSVTHTVSWGAQKWQRAGTSERTEGVRARKMILHGKDAFSTKVPHREGVWA